MHPLGLEQEAAGRGGLRGVGVGADHYELSTRAMDGCGGLRGGDVISGHDPPAGRG